MFKYAPFCQLVSAKQDKNDAGAHRKPVTDSLLHGWESMSIGRERTKRLQELYHLTLIIFAV